VLDAPQGLGGVRGGRLVGRDESGDRADDEGRGDAAGPGFGGDDGGPVFGVASLDAQR
jgi:hypothetical protein